VKPFPLASMGLIVTSVVADKDNATTVGWSEALGSDVTAHSAGKAIALPAGLTFPGSSIVFAEVSYRFKSTLSTMIVGFVPLKSQAYQVPRYSGQVAKK